MTDEPWRPLFASEGAQQEVYDALSEGVPVWMRASFDSWVTSLVNSIPSRDLQQALVLEVERRLRMQLDWRHIDHYGYARGLLASVATDEERLILADFLVSKQRADSSFVATLWRVLSEAGSAWTVGKRHPDVLGLIRRVPAGVQDAADAAFRLGDPGKLLRQAWTSIYGVHPNPSEGYRLAIKAVEAAAVPVVSPKNSNATFGTVVRDMENQRDWSLPFARQHDKAPTAQVVIDLMRAIWHGQHDRHGGALSSNLPLAVSQAEAETAVTGAVSLIHWFTSGALVRRG